MPKLDAFLYDSRAPLLFTSGTFLPFMVAFLLGYVVLTELGRRARRIDAATPGLAPPRWPFARAFKLGYLYAFSLYFYYKSSGLSVGLLLLTTLVDFELARAIHRSRRPLFRRAYLGLSLSLSLGLLGYFKYGNFLLDNLEALGSGSYERLDLILPVGISFYTFQSVSYVVDVYRRRLQPTDELLDYGLYLAFFPQIVAGPIVRAEFLFPQLENATAPTSADVREGLGRALLGIVKKAVIGDFLAGYSDVVFADYRALSGADVALGVYAYTLQIYFDFSGYSDLAIGLGRMLGFSLPENFDAPYRARSIADFWRRWHQSLSSWLRDYVYIGLGGNRRGTIRRDFNLLMTMLLGGLWHGAAWQFILWGGLHGVALVVEKRLAALRLGLPRGLSWFCTFHFVAFGWTLFRAPSLGAWWGLIERASEFHVSQLPAVLQARSDVLAVMGAGLLACFTPRALRSAAESAFLRIPPWARVVAVAGVVQLVLETRRSEVTPFIYFQF